MDKRMFDMSEYYRESCCDNKPARKPEATKTCDKEGCGSQTDCDDALTMVFINMQPLDSVYPLCDSFKRGTLFPNLDKPFLGGMKNE